MDDVKLHKDVRRVARVNLNLGVEYTSTGVQIAEEVFFTGFSFAFFHYNLAAWTLAALPILIPVVIVPLGVLKITHGITDKRMQEVEQFILGKARKESEIISGITLLAGLAAVPNAATLIGGWVPSFLLLPSLTLPCAAVAMSSLVECGFLLYRCAVLHHRRNQSHIDKTDRQELRNQLLLAFGKTIALIGLTVCAALAFPLAEMVVIAGLIGVVNLTLRYGSYRHSTLFKAKKMQAEPSVSSSHHERVVSRSHHSEVAVDQGRVDRLMLTDAAEDVLFSETPGTPTSMVGRPSQ